nr:hypothetical protein [Candidatus Omnitrophota bacterium]
MTRRSFALIELIIATVMLAIIIVSIYSVFSVGIKAWRRGSEGRDFQKIRIGLLRMQKELQNSFFFSEVPFKGVSKEIIFPMVISGENRDDVYVINYYIAEDRGDGYSALKKRKTLFMDNKIPGEKDADEVVFLANSINFEYAYELKNGLKGFKWKAAWGESQKKNPLAVKVNFSLGADEGVYHKIIFIMQGALGIE